MVLIYLVCILLWEDSLKTNILLISIELTQRLYQVKIVSNQQLLNSVDTLAKLSMVKLPVKTSFKLAKLSRIIDEILKEIIDSGELKMSEEEEITVDETE